MVKINEVEIATMLANYEIQNIVGHNVKIYESDKDNPDTNILKEIYKDLFNDKYEYFYNILTRYNYE